LQLISTNKYEAWRTLPQTPMTLIMGARCKDGVVLVADRKLTYPDRSQVNYGDKITGEIVGVLTAFSGDQGTFELFTNRVRNYVKTSEENA
jgi:20S proteasome alpha/beta subunit